MGWSGSGSSRGYGWEWSRTKKKILIRDSYLCQPCARLGLTVRAVDVDHIVPKFEGGTDEEHNLESICEDCHKTKTQAEARRARLRAARR